MNHDGGCECWACHGRLLLELALVCGSLALTLTAVRLCSRLWTR